MTLRYYCLWYKTANKAHANVGYGPFNAEQPLLLLYRVALENQLSDPAHSPAQVERTSHSGLGAGSTAGLRGSRSRARARSEIALIVSQVFYRKLKVKEKRGRALPPAERQRALFPHQQRRLFTSFYIIVFNVIFKIKLGLK